MKRVFALLLTAIMLLPLGGCVVYPDHRPGAYWVPGHFGPYGGWHRGHWQ